MNILIADDNTATRKMISQYLKKKGYDVFEASNGIEAFTSILEYPINIAIIDWILPGMDGIDVCRKIREKQKSSYVFIIMLTAKEEKQDLIEGFEAGVDEYIMKPVNLQELIARINVGSRIVHLEKKLLQKQRELTGNNEMKNSLSVLLHTISEIRSFPSGDLANCCLRIQIILMRNKTSF